MLLRALLSFSKEILACSTGVLCGGERDIQVGRRSTVRTELFPETVLYEHLLFLFVLEGFLLKRQKVLQQQARNSIRRRKIMSLFCFSFFSPRV